LGVFDDGSKLGEVDLAQCYVWFVLRSRLLSLHIFVFAASTARLCLGYGFEVLCDVVWLREKGL
jgi:hypothetical protein